MDNRIGDALTERGSKQVDLGKITVQIAGFGTPLTPYYTTRGKTLGEFLAENKLVYDSRVRVNGQVVDENFVLSHNDIVTIIGPVKGGMTTLIHSKFGSRKCDARCYGAKSTKCTCICNGMNHGKGFEIAKENTDKQVNEALAQKQQEPIPAKEV